MRRVALLCALMVGVANGAIAQTLPANAFGTLGMYPKRLSCSDLPTFSEPRPTHRLAAYLKVTASCGASSPRPTR